MAQQGPLSRYLGRRDINETANMQGIGLLHKIQSETENRKLAESFKRDELAAKREMFGETIRSREDIAAQADARQREMNQARLDFQEGQAKMTHELRMAGLRNDADRAAETARHNKQMEEIARLRADMAGIKPPKPIPQNAQDALTGAINSSRALDVIDKNIDESGVVKGWISKAGAVLGQNEEAIDFETAVNNLKVQAQSIIKGIPSNFDVQTFIRTIPDLTVAQQRNKARLKQTREALDQIVKDTLSYYKATGYQLPAHMVAFAKERGIDFDALKAWDEKTDPFASTQKILSTQPAVPSTGPSDGQRSKSKSGKPIIFRNGKWEYE